MNGKTLFVAHALPGETLYIKVTASHKRYDEAEATERVTDSPDRVLPICSHYAECGGCDLQHLNPTRAPAVKEALVLEMLKRGAGISPTYVEPPILSHSSGYRRSARVGINQRQRDGALLTGFRRRLSHKLLNIDQCPVLDSRLDHLFSTLHRYLDDLDGVRSITEVLISLGDESGYLKFRLTKPVSTEIKKRLLDIAGELKLHVWVEEGDKPSYPLDDSALKEQQRVHFNVDETVKITFQPGDFIQVNADVNRAMVLRAKEWLSDHESKTLLDLFCGLGNFSLPLAKQFKQVIGVEGSADMVKRATENAQHNLINNVHFYCADLTQPIHQTAWYRQHTPDIVLLDPPRSGAATLLPQLLPLKPLQILYIACNPSALARDAQTLVQAGYQLTRFCVLDMFPNTSHIESMALFEVNP